MKNNGNQKLYKQKEKRSFKIVKDPETRARGELGRARG